MSETTTLDASPETNLGAPADDEPTILSTETDGGAEQPDAIGSDTAPETPVTPPAPRTPQQIDALLRNDPTATLTAAEVQSHARWQQSVASTRSAIASQRTEVDNTFTAARDLIKSDWTSEIEAANIAGRDPDIPHIVEKMEGRFASLRQQADRSALAAFDADVDQWLFDASNGDTSQYEQWTKGQNLRQKMETQIAIAVEYGRRIGPTEGTVVLTQAELDARIQAAVNSARAATPSRGANVGSAGSPTPSRTDAEIMADPATPITQLKEIRDRQRAARGY